MNRRNRDTVPAVLAITGWLLLALTGSWPHVLLAQDSIDVDAVARDLEAFRGRLQALRRDIDKSRFEPDEQVDRLDYDAEPIIDFVTSEVAFNPYEGTLRGAAGTLQARAGNSLDQSLLLAYMLRSAGYDARIVRADLSDAQATALLLATANGAPPQSMDYLQDTVDSIMQDAPAKRGNIADTRLYRTMLAQEKELTRTLGAAGIGFTSSDATARLLPLVRSYFWVQHRDGPSSEWQDAHPAFGTNAAPQGLEAAEFFTESIPATYQHTFEMTAWIEQWFNGEIREHQVMQPWSGPVANLVGKALSYRNAPSGLTLETAGNLDDAMDKTTMFFPMLNGALAPGAQAFDMNGRLIDPFALGAGGMAGVFQTLGDKLESAVEGVSPRADGKPPLALHSMYLEFTFTTPSGQTDTRRRYLLPPRTDYGDDRAAAWQLITDNAYSVAVGDMPVDYLADRFLAVSAEGLDWLEFTIRKSFEPDVGIPIPDELSPDIPPLTQLWSMARRPAEVPGIVRFHAQPGLVGIRNGYRDAHTGFVGVDVVFNRVEHVRVNDAGLTDEPAAAMRNGIWDTVLESVPGKLHQVRTLATVSTVDVFDLARQQGIAARVLVDGDSDGPDLDAAASRFVQRDLERGYAVVIPERVPDGAAMPAWWRIDPRSGETLGMTGDGYGQDSVEYVILDMIGTVKGLAGGLNSIKACEEKPTMVTRLCCLVNAHADNVAGTAFGSMMGELLGTGTATLFDAADTATQAATGQGLVPSVGPMNCEAMPDTDW